MLVKKWSEALVLHERVLKYAKEAQSKAKSLNNSLKVGNAHRPANPVNFHSSIDACCESLQDLPDIQELIAEVNAEKYSLQAAAILGEILYFCFTRTHVTQVIYWIDCLLQKATRRKK